MDVVGGAIRQGLGAVREVLDAHGRWMVWNALLATVPFFVAVLLFHGSRARLRLGPGWWLGAAAFVAFLPNSPYVLTDVVHFLDDVRVAPSDRFVIGALVPVYGALFLGGLLAYVLSLRMLDRFLAARGTGLGVRVAVAGSLHALCAVGIYLGRVLRLNSWDLVADPGGVAAGLDRALGRVPIALVAATFLVLVTVSLVTRVVVDAAIASFHRAVRNLRSPGLSPG